MYINIQSAWQCVPAYDWWRLWVFGKLAFVDRQNACGYTLSNSNDNGKRSVGGVAMYDMAGRLIATRFFFSSSNR